MDLKNVGKIQSVQVLSYFRSTLILVLVAVLLMVITLAATVRVQRVTGAEKGVKINNITGEIEPVTQTGTIIYNGLLSSFHVLDKTEQRLEMTESAERGDRAWKDDLRLKTIDGSDIFLDLTINFILRPDDVKNILLTSGPGDQYKTKWVRDYSRSVCRTVFGELTTEEFYNNATERDKKAEAAKNELNLLLNPYGIKITSVIAEDFRFHQEYSEKIDEKKLADQGEKEEISKAKAAQEDLMFMTTEATNLKEVAITTNKGKMDQLVVDAKAEAIKLLREAEAYEIQTRLNADGQFFEKEKNAQAILAKTKAEAEGIRKMAEALASEGGHNIVKLEYTKRLQNMAVSGQPFVISSETQRFSHLEEGAAGEKRQPPKATPKQIEQK